MPIDPKYLEGRPNGMPFTAWVMSELERRDKLIADLEAERDGLREYAAKIGKAHVEEETLRNDQIAKLTSALELMQKALASALDEVGKKRAANWETINDASCAARDILREVHADA